MSESKITHDDVQNFYGNAAKEPDKNLCCPTTYPYEDTNHIPQDVIERFYGCGSPVIISEITEGETVVDLGSGAGIDCFIASKKVGPDGVVIGIDMTDEMLRVANNSKDSVTKNIGYDNVEFRKGFLENMPVEDDSVDLITSNCVINLSPDKSRVFREMSRVLKNFGRIVISDIVSEIPLPKDISENSRLWAECIGGCLTQNELISAIEKAGLYGVEVLGKTFWRTERNIRFYSITLRAYKFQKTSGCIYSGQKAVYKGPLKVVIDDEGHVYPRNQEVEICTDTANKLINPPYDKMFIIIEPDNNKDEDETSCCSTDGSACC